MYGRAVPWAVEDRPRVRLQRWVGGVSMVAGAIHGVVAPAHFEEWWGYGLFFVVASAAQVLFGLALVTRAIGPHSGPGWQRLERGLWVAGVVGNLAIIVLYLVTRTVGVPYGPEAGQVEAIAALDVASKIAEALVIAGLAVLLLAHRDVARA